MSRELVEREQGPTPAAPAGAGRAVAGAGLAPLHDRSPGAVLALQRLVGNSAVTRMLAREATPDWSTQAKAEATAAATRAHLKNDLLPFMAAHKSKIVRNTAELFTGATPLLGMDAITKRSDSAAELAKPSTPHWADPTLFDAFFTGVTMSNTDFHQKNMIGTLDGTTMFVRGHDSAGKVQSLDDMAGTITHECSHFFVKQYGELPQTGDAGSFDRYADEFRAYWVQYGDWTDLPAKEKTAKIREQLLGTPGDPASGYPNFRAAYYAAGPGPNAFKAQVDALTGPIGFNLTNSIRLHRLWQLFQDVSAGKANFEDIVLAIDALPAGERVEAAGSSLIAGLSAKLGVQHDRQVRAALSAPTKGEYTDNLNPAKSAAISTFYAAIVNNVADEIKKAYTALPKEDRRQVWRNPAFMAYVDHHLLDSAARACLYAMTETWNVAQWDAMAAFIDTLRQAKLAADAGTLNGVPADVTAAMAKLHEFARWTFFSWEREGAVKEYVDVLPGKVAWQIKEALRD